MFIVSESWVGSDDYLSSNAEVFSTKELAIDYVKATFLDELLQLDYTDWEESRFESGDYNTDSIRVQWHFIEVKGKLVEE